MFIKPDMTGFIDYVCEMKVQTDEISLDYQGVHYAFCSEQCRERFQINPHLYIGYPGNKAPKQKGDVILKSRKLKLDEPLSADIVKKVLDNIQAMMGINHIEIEGDTIYISYDLLQATEAQIEEKIVSSGVSLGNDLAERLRRAFVNFMEETHIDSLEVRPHNHRH